MADVPQEDLRMLHNEILQTVNQRFLTTTASIALLGVLSSVAVQQAPSELLVLFLSALLIGAVFVLYIQIHLLRIATYTLASYIHLRGWSEYQADLSTYRKEVRQGAAWRVYTNAHTWIFIAMCATGTLLPWMTAWGSKRQIDAWSATYAIGALGILAGFVIAGMGFSDWFADRISIEKKWERVLRKTGRIK